MFLRGLPTLQRNNMLKRSLMILCGLTAAAGLSIISTSVSPSLCFVSGHLQNRLSRYSGTSTQERTSPPRQGSNARPGVKPWGYKGNRLGGVHPADGLWVFCYDISFSCLHEKFLAGYFMCTCACFHECLRGEAVCGHSEMEGY